MVMGSFKVLRADILDVVDVLSALPPFRIAPTNGRYRTTSRSRTDGNDDGRPPCMTASTCPNPADGSQSKPQPASPWTSSSSLSGCPSTTPSSALPDGSHREASLSCRCASVREVSCDVGKTYVSEITQCTSDKSFKSTPVHHKNILST